MMSISRVLAILACVTLGHAAAAGLFWWFVNVPESNVAMLALSATLIVLLMVVAGWTEVTATLLWNPAVGFRGAARRAFRALPAFVVAVLVFALLWWVTARADAWASEYGGQLDAWWMANVGSTKTAWIHSGLAIALWFIRYVIAVSLGVAALAAGALHGSRALASTRWVRAGLSRRQIGAIGFAIVLLVWLPLRATDWRPASIPPTTMEALFVAVKLGVIYLVANLGWALVLLAGARGAASRPISAAFSAPSPS